MIGLECTYNGFQNFATVSTIARWDIGNSNSLIVVIEDDTRATSVAAEEEVILDIHYTVDIS